MNIRYCASHHRPLALQIGAILCSVASGSFAQIEEVIVTAQKREQTVQDVPAVVEVLSASTLETYQVSRISEMADLIPGFVYSRAPNDNPGITFRGIGTQAGNLGFDSSIGFFQDGMFLGHQRLAGITQFDIERIEFIKGTQSTLLGKNTSLGAVSVVTRKPGTEFGGSFEGGGEFENGGGFGEGAVDLPVNEQLRFRVAGRYSDLDGWITNVATGNEVQANKDIGLRVTGVFEFGEGADVTLQYQYTDNERHGSPAQMTDPGLSALGLGTDPATGTVVDLGEARFNHTKAAFSSDPRMKDGEDFLDLESHLVNLTINVPWQNHTLTSVTSYSAYGTEINYDFDFNVKDASTFNHDEQFWQVSEEFRITSATGQTVEYLAGIFYFKSEWDETFEHNWGIPDFPPGAPIQGLIFNGPYDHDFRNRVETFSIFGQATWNITDRWRFNVGLRYTDETKKVTYGRFARAPFTLWNTVINAPFPLQPLRFEDSFPTGTFSFQYDLTDDVMVYASAARGGKSGGFGEFNTVPCDPALSPCIPAPGLAIGNPERDARVEDERTNNYEIGAKMQLLGGAMNFNIAAYWTDVFGLQQLVFLPSGLFASSNDRVRARGFDGAMAWQMTDQLTFNGAFTFVDSEDRKTGLRPVLSPKWSGNAGLTWEQPVFGDMTLGISGIVRHRSEKHNQIRLVATDNGFTSKSITQFDASIRLAREGQGWYLSLAGTNLTDEFTSDFAFAGPDPFVGRYDSTAPLRTVKLIGGYSF